MAPRVEVLVSVDDANLHDVDSVAEKLRSAGMKVENTMPALGTIAGTADPSTLEVLRTVKGVSDLERGREYQIAPPDADIQ